MEFVKKHRTGLLFGLALALAVFSSWLASQWALPADLPGSSSPIVLISAGGGAAIGLVFAAVVEVYLTKWIAGVSAAYPDDPDVWPRLRSWLYSWSYGMSALSTLAGLPFFDQPGSRWSSLVGLGIDCLAAYLLYVILDSQTPKISRTRRLITVLVYLVLCLLMVFFSLYSLQVFQPS